MPINPRLTKLRVLGLEETERAKMLTMRWLYYEQRQDDGLTVDWEGYQRHAGESYLQHRFRGRGYVRAQNSSIPFGQKRPHCHSMLVGETVDTYTSLLLGKGRQPAIRVIGDDESTEAVEAIFGHAGFWPVMAEARKLGGAMGASAVLPEVKKGKLSLRTIRPEHMYVEWVDEAQWIPEIVIEQTKVEIERLSKHDGRIETVEVWRTRAWDETHSYAYVDVPVESYDGERERQETSGPRRVDIELDGDPVEHRAGRCPVVWVQNTLNSAGPIGTPDCEAVFEQVEQLDRSLSMVMRGSRANNDPTLVIKDTRSMLQQWTKRSKGYGQVIEVSDKGAASLLETSGSAVAQSWESIEKLEARVERRVGLTSPTADNSGAYQSGVALQILHRTQTSRAGERRNPLGIGIIQLARIVHTMLRDLGIKPVGSDGPGIEMPPREVKEPDDDGKIETEIAEHEIGPGGAISLTWPAMHEPIPEELRTAADALGKMTGGLPVLSQETAVAYATNLAQTDTDPATELERIRGERESKVAEFDEAMMPDVDGEDLDEDEAAGEVEQTADGVAKGEQVQHEAMNGIQIKTLGDTLARTGKDLSEEAARFTIHEGFPNTTSPERASRLDEALAAQKAKASEDGGDDSGQRFDTLGRPVTRGKAPEAQPPEPEPEQT